MKPLSLGFVASLVLPGWEMAKNLVELFLTQLVCKKRPECLTARFLDQ